MICFDPESVSADPYSLMASGQRCAALRVPAAGDPLQIELITLEIPIATLQQLDLSYGQMPVEFGIARANAFLASRSVIGSEIAQTQNSLLCSPASK
ncbi:MAG: hypothetical protein QOD09_2969 [Bradyrhizobium sp.]|jgi:hypothetical protein|nr:hypothetical protein [Bradyrhizobium sp.]